MSYKLVGLVTIPVGAFLGAFVQPFVIDGDCEHRLRVLDASRRLAYDRLKMCV